MPDNPTYPTTISDGEYIVTDASAPFDDPNADAILRSSDNTDFRVIRNFLSYGSDFFKDLFALPQATEGGGNEMKDGLPVIRVTERGKILEMLLLMCYPMGAVDPPVLEDVEEINALLEAAIKYNVERVEKRARRMLLGPRFLAVDPLRVFAIACRLGLEEDARVAARATLNQSIFKRPYGPELDFVTARKLCQLEEYRMECIAAARKAVDNQSWLDGLPFSPCYYCHDRFSHQITLISTGWNKMQLGGTLSENGVKELVKAAAGPILRCDHCRDKTLGYIQEYSRVMWDATEVAVSSVRVNLQLRRRYTAEQLVSCVRCMWTLVYNSLVRTWLWLCCLRKKIKEWGQVAV